MRNGFGLIAFQTDRINRIEFDLFISGFRMKLEMNLVDPGKSKYRKRIHSFNFAFYILGILHSHDVQTDTS
jgi:hypothetical protein